MRYFKRFNFNLYLFIFFSEEKKKNIKCICKRWRTRQPDNCTGAALRGVIQPGDTDALPAEGAETSTPMRNESNWGTVPVKLLFWCETEEVLGTEMIFEDALPVESCAATGFQTTRSVCVVARVSVSTSVPYLGVVSALRRRGKKMVIGCIDQLPFKK